MFGGATTKVESKRQLCQRQSNSAANGFHHREISNIVIRMIHKCKHILLNVSIIVMSMCGRLANWPNIHIQNVCIEAQFCHNETNTQFMTFTTKCL